MKWTASLATRSATLWSVLAALAAGTSSWVVHRDAESRYLDTLRERVLQEASHIQIKTQTSVATLRDDARFCSQSPLLREFLLHRGTPDEPRWRHLLEEEFHAVFLGKPAYFQMRLLALKGPEDGRELVRLDRRQGQVAVTPLEQLQGKAGRTYFQEARHLPADQVYLSEINLNRDFGSVSLPHTPTLRAASKVQVPNGGEALLIINANMDPLFQELRQSAGPTSQVRLISSRGDYLMHPDPQAAFASDLNHPLYASRDFPEWNDWHHRSHGFWLRHGDSAPLAWAQPIPLDGWPPRSLIALVSLPGKAWLPDLQASRLRSYAVTFAAALLGGGAAFLIALPMIRRLHLLSSALHRFDATGSPDALPEAGDDEIGLAVRRFREMATKVRQQIDRLHEARQEAESANALKEHFLAVMSHEIRTPLNAVIGLVQALETSDPPDRQRPLLNTLRSSADNLMALVNTALDYTRLKEGDFPFLDEDFDMAQLVRDTVKAHLPAAMAKGLRLECQGASEPLALRGDPVRSRQVLTNLLHNAIKFTSTGYVRVDLASSPDHGVTVTVSDSGPGIDPQDHERIFEPFGQTATSRRSREAGAGLGLTVTRALLEQQGGSLTLTSSPAPGATFHATWPFRPSRRPLPSPNSSTSATPPLPSLAGRQLLYVEDVASNRQVMELTLESTGAHLTCAATGQEALDALQDSLPDLILIDLQLPDMTGDILAAKIKSLPQAHSVPLLAVTAQASKDVAIRCQRAGMETVILKPYSKATLLREITTRLSPADAIDLQKLQDLHPHSEERRQRLALTLAEELRQAARETYRILDIDARDGRSTARKALHHRLKTCIETLDLREVCQAFLELQGQPDIDDDEEALTQSLAAALDRAAAALSATFPAQPTVPQTSIRP